MPDIFSSISNLQFISSFMYLSCTDKTYLFDSYFTIIALSFCPYAFMAFSTSATSIGLLFSSVLSKASDKLSTSISTTLSFVAYKSLKLLTSIK